MKEEILRLEKVTKIVDGVTRLDNFNLHIFQGEIMGLICINAHGQKELIELICQNLPIHYGRVYLNEIMVNNYEHNTYSMNKVSVIEKQSRLVKDLTVSDNIFVLRRGFKKYYINKNILNSQLKIFLEEIGIQIDGNELISNLTSFQKCIVELLKAVVMGVKLVIIKDISNYISAADLVKFQGLLKYYCEQGFSFLYICNHHEEAFEICTRVSLMENGKILKVLDQKDFTREKMEPYYMDFYDEKKSKTNRRQKEKILQFKNVSTDNFKDMSFTIQKGECVVLLDMNNTVLADIMELMQGKKAAQEGSVYLDGRVYFVKDVYQALELGVGFIGENPFQSMAFQELSYLENLSFLLDRRKEKVPYNKRIQKSIIQEYEPLVGKDIYEKDITSLSLKSLYNMIYYRIHLFNPKVVFCVQPFSGADMYLRLHIIELIQRLKQKGITVIILAVNISDSLVVADRLMVFEQGCLSKESDGAELYVDHE